MMTRYVALLRAVNVGGTGKLAMDDLKALCAELGFKRIETYIASGNVVFDCTEAPRTIEARMEERLLADTGKSIAVFVRSAAQMRAVLTSNPFADREPKLTHAFFLRDKPRSGILDEVRGQVEERILLGLREIYVYYPSGAGRSKLQIPAARLGTARNLNTVAKLVEISSSRFDAIAAPKPSRRRRLGAFKSENV